MLIKFNSLLLKRTFVVSLPVLTGILATMFSKAHFKVFCLYKLFFHKECYGCGLTRAVAALCRLDFAGAYELNHLIVIVIPMLFVLWGILLCEAFSYQKKNKTTN